VSNDQFAPLRLHGSRSSKPAAKQGKGKAGAFQSGLGRWYALQPAEVLHGQDRERSAVGWVHHLLQSYAVVTKEVAEQQSFVEWSKLQDALKQLEHWGLMTRGFWIAGIPYLQFGASETVERLRQPLPQASPAAGSELTLLSSVDPANPYGLMLKWPEGEGLGYSRKPGNFLLIENGEWVLWVEKNGRRIHPLTDSWKPGTVKQDLMRDVFKRLFKIAGLRKLVIDSWRGADFEEEKVAAAFGALGAERDRASMVIWPSGLR
jgi:ATP-dependent Lhr-like helicase